MLIALMKEDWRAGLRVTAGDAATEPRPIIEVRGALPRHSHDGAPGDHRRAQLGVMTTSQRMVFEAKSRWVGLGFIYV